MKIFFSGKEYADIFHSLDVWHGAKNLSKRLTKVSSVPAKSPLKSLEHQNISFTG